MVAGQICKLISVAINRAHGDLGVISGATMCTDSRGLWKKVEYILDGTDVRNAKQ